MRHSYAKVDHNKLYLPARQLPFNFISTAAKMQFAQTAGFMINLNLQIGHSTPSRTTGHFIFC